jgi:outer membrane lipoprotein-sorting protein
MQSQTELSPKLQSVLDTSKAQTTTQQQDEQMQQRLLARIAAYEQGSTQQDELTAGFVKRLKDQLNYVWQGLNLRWIGSAAFACMLAISLFVVTSTSTPAFAAVVKKLSQITSMYYSGTMTTQGQALMQLDVYYRAPNLVRIENLSLAGDQEREPIINIMDVQQGKGLILMPQTNMAMPFDFSPNKGGENSLSPDDPLSWFNAILHYQGAVKHLAAQTINGVSAVGYEIYVSDMSIVLWVDVKTNLPIKLKVEKDVENGQSAFIFEADLQFNQQLDDKLFSLLPDPSYTIGQGDED